MGIGCESGVSLIKLELRYTMAEGWIREEMKVEGEGRSIEQCKVLVILSDSVRHERAKLALTEHVLAFAADQERMEKARRVFMFAKFQYEGCCVTREWVLDEYRERHFPPLYLSYKISR